MRLCPHLCAALNFISYDKRHDARPVASDGNPIALTPMFCLSESDTFYLYPYPTDNRTGDRSVSRRATRCSIYQDINLSSLLFYFWYHNVIYYHDMLSKRQLNFCDLNLQSRKSELHILALLCKKSLTNDSVFCPFYSKFAWSTDHKVCGRPTIGCLHDRP